MLTYLDESTADEMEERLAEMAVVSVWMGDDGDYFVVTNMADRRAAGHVLAGAVLEAIRQDYQTPQ